MRALTCLAIFGAAFFLVALGQQEADRGVRAYERGDYAEAEAAFRQALADEPENSRLLYNLGSTLARQGAFEEASELLSRFRASAPAEEDQARAEYNLGKVYSDQEEWEQALTHFRNSLKIDPGDEDARFNFELAYRKNQQEQQEQSQQQPQDAPVERPPAEEGEQDGEQLPDQLPQPGEQQDIPESELQEMPEMNPEQANEMLDALDNIEQNLLRDYLQQQVEMAEGDGKDW